MENASKAMIIVASMVISVMILGILVYLFVQAGRVPAQFEYTKQAEDVALYNSKIEKYVINSDVDGSGTLDADEILTPSNSFSDLISACNLAYDINCKNDNDRKYSLKVDIDIDGDEYCVFPKTDENENSVLKKGMVFKCNTTQESQMTADNMIDLYSIMETEIDTGYKINDIKYDTQGKLRYKYYFDCEADYGLNEKTEEFENGGRVTNIMFTLVKNECY